ncbi:ANTAR domain-containing protein [Geodermatophilus maliterrae]|jgi:AmiR/NasT family two-component response regulator|uniref:ANTAR domain-containing protein n=1 Tax=Geodermatophilus maliterrae TaxID=3162531 RepID=A0ABV3XMR4_9ACTN
MVDGTTLDVVDRGNSSTSGSFAMVTRHIVDQAQGILMERFQMTAEQASALLTRACQDANVELRDVAQRLINTGETVGR